MTLSSTSRVPILAATSVAPTCSATFFSDVAMQM